MTRDCAVGTRSVRGGPGAERVNAQDHTRIAVAVDPLLQRIAGTAVHGNIDFDAPYMSEVGNNLWQGGCAEGLVLPTLIDNVLSLYPWEAYEVRHPLTNFREVRMHDDTNQVLDDVVPELATWVNRCRQTGPTLVHCQAGLNRSGVVVAYALMLDGLSADEAIARIRERRSPAVLCNPQFERWLRSQSVVDEPALGSVFPRAVRPTMRRRPDEG